MEGKSYIICWAGNFEEMKFLNGEGSWNFLETERRGGLYRLSCEENGET